MTNPLFGDDTVETPTEIDPKTAMETLVGEGKKYKTTEDAIKALWHSQQHIARLENERAQQQAALNERRNGEDLLALIESKLKATSNEPPPVVSERVPSNNGNTPAMSTITAEDIERLLEQKLAQKSQATTAETNLNKVVETLKSNWGPGYQADLRAKASEMGVTPDYLLDLAKNSPSVFLSAVGGNSKKGSVTNSLPPASSFSSTIPGQQPQARNYAFYEKLRTTNKAEYWSPKVQNQMLKDLSAMGDKFYS